MEVAPQDVPRCFKQGVFNGVQANAIAEGLPVNSESAFYPPGLSSALLYVRCTSLIPVKFLTDV